MSEKYYTDENGVLRGVCDEHGEFVGNAIGCPKCFAEDEEAARQYETHKTNIQKKKGIY